MKDQIDQGARGGGLVPANPRRGKFLPGTAKSRFGRTGQGQPAVDPIRQGIRPERLVATNDVHYINKGDSHAHDCLVCIGTQDLLSNPKRMKRGLCAGTILSAQRGGNESAFCRGAGCGQNTLEVAEKCISRSSSASCITRFFIRPSISRAKGFYASGWQRAIHPLHHPCAGARSEFVVTGVDNPARLPTYSRRRCLSRSDLH